MTTIRSPIFGETFSIPPLSPTASPYRLPPILKSHSGNDLVSGIVDKFNSLSMTERGEEKDRFEREITRLRAALDRAVIAREEAEDEARQLRERLVVIQEETIQDRNQLQTKALELEKKYEKAKERFKMQRIKNDEAMHAVKQEFMEAEKDRWRSIAVAQEAEEWERKLYNDALDLVEYMELEKRLSVHRSLSTTDRQRKSLRHRLSQAGSDRSLNLCTISVNTKDTKVQDMLIDDINEVELISTSVTKFTTFTADSTQLQQSQSLPVIPRINTEITLDIDQHDDLREVTPEGPASLAKRNLNDCGDEEFSIALSYRTPIKHTLTIPVRFDPDTEIESSEDKENHAPLINMTPNKPSTPLPPYSSLSTPTTHSYSNLLTLQEMNRTEMIETLKTPSTIDRAAALKAIESRRLRARSMALLQPDQGQSGEQSRDVMLRGEGDLRNHSSKREVSAPAWVGGSPRKGGIY